MVDEDLDDIDVETFSNDAINSEKSTGETEYESQHDASISMLKLKIKDLEKQNLSLRDFHLNTVRSQSWSIDELKKKISVLEKENKFSKLENIVSQQSNSVCSISKKNFTASVNNLFKGTQINDLVATLKFLKYEFHSEFCKIDIELVLSRIEDEISKKNSKLDFVPLIILFLNNSRVFKRYFFVIKSACDRISQHLLLEIIDVVPLEFLHQFPLYDEFVVDFINNSAPDLQMRFFTRILDSSVLSITRYMTMSHFNEIVRLRKYKEFTRSIVGNAQLCKHYVSVENFIYLIDIIEEFLE